MDYQRSRHISLLLLLSAQLRLVRFDAEVWRFFFSLKKDILFFIFSACFNLFSSLFGRH